jgi:hypothetical protein
MQRLYCNTTWKFKLDKEVHKMEFELRKIIKVNYKNNLAYFVHRRGQLQKDKAM